MSDLAAVLDACVIIPAPTRDTLLRAAAAGLYRPHWSDMILREVERNLVENGMTSAQQARSLIATLQRAFPDAMISGFELLVDAMPNDPKDRHVLAAAVVAGAQIVVTDNVADFTPTALQPLGITAQSVDVLLTDLYQANPDTLAQIVQRQAADLRAPAMTVDDLLARISRQAPTFAALVEEYLSRSS